MSQDNLIHLECTVCHRINYQTKKNKKLNQNRLVIMKYCKWDKKRTEHKETK